MEGGALRLGAALVLAPLLGALYDRWAGASARSRAQKCAALLLCSYAVLLAAYPPGVVAGLHVPPVFAYAAVRLLRRWRWMPAAVLAGLLAHLSAAHVRRYLSGGDGDASDPTGVLMVGVMRLSGFAFDAQGKGPAGQAFRRLPGPLEFAAFALFFPGVLAGPFVPYAAFRAFLSGETAGAARKAGAGRFRVLRLARVLLLAAAAAAVHVLLAPRLPAAFMAEDAFARWGLPARLLYCRASNFAARAKYYFAWGLAEAAYLGVGLGFRADAPDAWDALCNADALAIEAAPDFRALVTRWNVSTNRWLHAYVYTRAAAFCGRASAAPLTYLVSAFWHGFHPAYYLVFVSGAWVTHVSRMAHARLSFPLRDWPVLRRIVGNAFTMALAAYVLTPFVLLDLRRSLRFWAGFRFWGHVLLAAAHAGLSFVPRRPPVVVSRQ